MKRKISITVSLIVLLLANVSCISSANGGEDPKKETKKKPNIIFFIADDMHKYMFNCLPEGQGKNLTPNIDKLAEEGTVLLGQHVSSSVCTPSRFSCLTGKYASRSRSKKLTNLTKKMGGETVVQWNSYITSSDQTIAHLLKEQGYVTGFYGKNHAVEAPGWEKLPLKTDPKTPAAKKVLMRNAEIIRAELKKAGFDYAGGNYQDNPSYLGPEKLRVQNLDWVTEKSLNFLDENDDKPFFLYFATTVPHGPSNAKQSWNGDRTVTPEGILDEEPTVLPNKSTIAERIRKAGLDKNGKIPDAVANTLWIDDALGALIRKLDEKGELDNTIIFFFNDHGQYAKGSIYEGGVSSPSIIWRKDGFKCGNRNEALVSNIDFAPTILEFAGGDPAQVEGFDGKSLMPILNAEKEAIHESLFFEMGFSRGILKDDFKYIALRYPEFAMNWTKAERQAKLDEWNDFRKANKLTYHHTDPMLPFSHLMLIPGGGDAEYPSTQKYKHYYETDQLYDLANDPNEQNNLYGKEEHAVKLAELQEELTVYLNDLPGIFGEFKTEAPVQSK